MRIIFDVFGKPQASVHLSPYGGRVDDPKPWHGARCELMWVDCIDWDKDTRKEGDAIYIEGSADTIRKMLTDALSLLDINERYVKEHAAKQFDRSLSCPTCGAFADPISEWHGDGKGNACYGLATERVRLVTEQAQRDAVAIEPKAHMCHRPGCGKMTTLGTAWCQSCLDEAREERLKHPPRKPRPRPKVGFPRRRAAKTSQGGRSS